MTMPPAEPPALAIQEALHGIASSDVELAGLTDGVFDYVPESIAGSYVVIGGADTRPDDTHQGHGWHTIAELSVWSPERGFRIPLQITSRLVQLFVHQPLPLDGFHHVDTRFRRERTLRDPNPRIRRDVLELDIRTENEERQT